MEHGEASRTSHLKSPFAARRSGSVGPSPSAGGLTDESSSDSCWMKRSVSGKRPGSKPPAKGEMYIGRFSRWRQGGVFMPIMSTGDIIKALVT